MSDAQAIVETRVFGHFVRVTAIDPQTLLEVTFQVPRNCVRTEIERLALAKLDYVRRRREAGGLEPSANGRRA
ncbi:MAG: hypothetical protein R3C97_17975 [Geminicoccaceae bacterium]